MKQFIVSFLANDVLELGLSSRQDWRQREKQVHFIRRPEFPYLPRKAGSLLL